MRILVLLALLVACVAADVELATEPVAVYSTRLLVPEYKGPLLRAWCELHEITFYLYPLEDGEVAVWPATRLCGDTLVEITAWFDQTGSGLHLETESPVQCYLVGESHTPMCGVAEPTGTPESCPCDWCEVKEGSNEMIYGSSLINKDYFGPLLCVWCEKHKTNLDLFPRADGSAALDQLETYCDGVVTVQTWYDQGGGCKHAKVAHPQTIVLHTSDETVYAVPDTLLDAVRALHDEL